MLYNMLPCSKEDGHLFKKEEDATSVWRGKSLDFLMRFCGDDLYVL